MRLSSRGSDKSGNLGDGPRVLLRRSTASVMSLTAQDIEEHLQRAMFSRR